MDIDPPIITVEEEVKTQEDKSSKRIKTIVSKTVKVLSAETPVHANNYCQLKESSNNVNGMPENSKLEKHASINNNMQVEDCEMKDVSKNECNNSTSNNSTFDDAPVVEESIATTKFKIEEIVVRLDEDDNKSITCSKSGELNTSHKILGKCKGTLGKTDSTPFQEVLEIDSDDSMKEGETSTCKENKSESLELHNSEVKKNAGEVCNLVKDNNGNDKKDCGALVDNQVQCVNLHCQSGYDLAEAPVFVLTYFGVLRRKNVLQKVCRECFDMALKHQEVLSEMLKFRVPLMTAEFPSQKDNVVVMDSVEEIYEEDILPSNVIATVEEHLMEVMQSTFRKYDIDYQIEESQNILDKKYNDLEDANSSINKELQALDKRLQEARELIYKDFTPRIKSLPPLNLIEHGERLDTLRPFSLMKGRTVATKKVTHVPKCILPPTYVAPVEPSHDVVAVKEVEFPMSELPPIGTLIRPQPVVSDQVFVMKFSYFGVWVRARIIEILNRSPDGIGTYRVSFSSSYRSQHAKTVTGKQIAYVKPSHVRYPVGTRVIAVFEDTDHSKKDTYYVGIIAEPPKHINKFRYLVFFDDGYAQYVVHDKIHLVCECSKAIHEDIHPDSRDFIKNYLDQYPERPMVKLQQGQILKTEWNGKWWIARALEIDGSLAKMHFDADGRTEWIYRGSTRLGPLYTEIIAAATRKEQGALSRHRSMGIASLKKRNMPYVEYSVDQDDAKSPQQQQQPQQQVGVSKNVAKKSTASRSNNTETTATDKAVGPPKPFEKMEYPSKGYTRVMELPGRIVGRVFVPHQCNPACVEWTRISEADCKGINPLARPLFFGFERQVVQARGKRSVMYRGPCGRRLRNMTEMHRYLRITKTPMGLDLFDYDHWVHVLSEFHLEPPMYCTYLKDLSYGRENSPVSCVNEINHSWPLFMDYSTCRQPQDGVNINLDQDFLVCCDCTDDCQDKEKCQCWQLTIEGTRLGPDGEVDPTVGYQFKRLPEPVTTGIYECNSRCKCSSTCLNRVVQHPLQLNLQVFRTLKKGWGIRALNDIPLGCFICIYAGRLHTEQSANDGGRMYGDEYLAELDYIEVVEGFKEGYEDDVIEPEEENNSSKSGGGVEGEQDDEPEEEELPIKEKNDKMDKDYVPLGLKLTRKPGGTISTRAQRKKISEETFENAGEKVKEKEKEKETETETEKEEIREVDDGSTSATDEDDEMKKTPSKFTPAVPADAERKPKYKSVREYFGDGADDCYIMDAKLSGNIGRYLNHSCKPNVFVQNVFVDTHDVRFPWVAFFALSHIKAGTELTWDYNYDIGSVPDKILYCYCNNIDCRGRLL